MAPVATGTDVTVYFRPETEWTSRALWLHAYPPGSADYLDVSAVNGPARLQPRELGWAVFKLPHGRFDVYVGMSVGLDLGEGSPLGVIPR
jgi:hypothetical protein